MPELICTPPNYDMLIKTNETSTYTHIAAVVVRKVAIVLHVCHLGIFANQRAIVSCTRLLHAPYGDNVRGWVENALADELIGIDSTLWVYSTPPLLDHAAKDVGTVL
jgi:hypothetical protein